MNRIALFVVAVSALILTGCAAPEPVVPPASAPSSTPTAADPIVAPQPRVDATCDELLPTGTLSNLTLSAPIAGPQYLSESVPSFVQRQQQWTSCSWQTESTDSALQSLVSLTIRPNEGGALNDEVAATCVGNDRTDCRWQEELSDGHMVYLYVDGATHEDSVAGTTEQFADLASQVKAAIEAAPRNPVWSMPAGTLATPATCADLLPQQAIADALGGTAGDVAYTDLDEFVNLDGYLHCEFSSSFTESFGAQLTALEGGEWAWVEQRDGADVDQLEIDSLDEGDSAWIADESLYLIVGHTGVTVTVPEEDFGSAPDRKDVALASIASAIVAGLGG